MLYGDMAYLPWFEFPEEYHFGGHTFVVCGYDGKITALASDMDPQASGLKKGFHYPITLEQLRVARNSKHKPFPPKNMYLEFDFTDYHDPSIEDIHSAINQTCDSMLHPPTPSPMITSRPTMTTRKILVNSGRKLLRTALMRS